jgi:oxygen-independent coproporphyrinogen-3 oxidase
MAAPALYVHVPFCVVKCGYCDFHSVVPRAEAELDVYLDGLARELEIAGVPRRPPSVFLGGGTPSYLDAERLRRFFALLNERVDLEACPEVTLECNPESVTAEKAAIARAAGVNRVSVGAQSFDAARLRFLDRAHDAERTRAAVGILREAGFLNLSLDLMFGLPGQQVGDWERDLDAALLLSPDHLSCYNLTFEPGTRLHLALQQRRVQRNDEAADLAMFWRTRERLAAAGFLAYEISNFAGRGGICRHNDNYWLQGDYVGVGPGASSHDAGKRWTNLRPLDAWHGSLRRREAPVASVETLDARQRAGEAVWLGLRRTDGVDLAAVQERLGAELPPEFEATIGRLVGQGWLERRGTRIALTRAGLPFADSAAAAFLGNGR